MLTKKDLIKRWAVSSRTIDRWMSKKNLPFVKSPLNGHVHFIEEEISKWEKSKGLRVTKD